MTWETPPEKGDCERRTRTLARGSSAHRRVLRVRSNGMGSVRSRTEMIPIGARNRTEGGQGRDVLGRPRAAQLQSQQSRRLHSNLCRESVNSVCSVMSARHVHELIYGYGIRKSVREKLRGAWPSVVPQEHGSMMPRRVPRQRAWLPGQVILLAVRGAPSAAGLAL